MQAINTIRNRKRKVSKRQRNRYGRYPYLPSVFYTTLRGDYRTDVSYSTGSGFTIDLSNVTSGTNVRKPYYVDHLLHIYQSYVVYAVELEWIIVNMSVGNGTSSEVVVGNAVRAAHPSLTFPIALSLKDSQRRMITALANQDTVSMKQFINLERHYPGNFMDDSDFWGDATYPPPICTASDGDNLFAFFIASHNSTGTISVRVDVRINYLMKFFNFVFPSVPSGVDQVAVTWDEHDDDALPEVVTSAKSRPSLLPTSSTSLTKKSGK